MGTKHKFSTYIRTDYSVSHNDKTASFFKEAVLFTHSLISVLLLSESGFHPVPDLMVG